MVFDNLILTSRRTLSNGQTSVLLDAVIAEFFNDGVASTSQIVESGAEVSDHAVVLPRLYSFEAVITDSPLGLAGINTVAENISAAFTSSEQITRSQQGFRDLRNIMLTLEPVSVTTKLGRIDNLLIENIQVNQNASTSNAIRFFMELRERQFRGTETVAREQSTVRSDAQAGASSTVNQGRQIKQEVDSTQVSQSLLFKLGQAVGVL